MSRNPNESFGLAKNYRKFAGDTNGTRLLRGLLLISFWMQSAVSIILTLTSTMREFWIEHYHPVSRALKGLFWIYRNVLIRSNRNLRPWPHPRILISEIFLGEEDFTIILRISNFLPIPVSSYGTCGYSVMQTQWILHIEIWLGYLWIMPPKSD